jgi:membrane protein implicated in regulation of membrane protease activity
MSRIVVPSTSKEQDIGQGRIRDRLLWLCPFAAIAVAAAILWLFGLTVWTAIAAALLIGCPLAIAWALLTERIGKRDSTRTAP